MTTAVVTGCIKMIVKFVSGCFCFITSIRVTTFRVVTCISCISTLGTCRLCNFGLEIQMLTSSMFGHPTILHLYSRTIEADYTIKGNLITNYRLSSHTTIKGSTICAVYTVNVNRIYPITDSEVAVCIVCNIGNRTGYVILTRSKGVVRIKRTKNKSLLDCKFAICCGRNNSFTYITYIVFFVTGMLAGSGSGYDTYNFFAIKTSCSNSTLCTTGCGSSRLGGVSVCAIRLARTSRNSGVFVNGKCAIFCRIITREYGRVVTGIALQGVSTTSICNNTRFAVRRNSYFPLSIRRITAVTISCSQLIATRRRCIKISGFYIKEECTGGTTIFQSNNLHIIIESNSLTITRFGNRCRRSIVVVLRSAESIVNSTAYNYNFIISSQIACISY